MESVEFERPETVEEAVALLQGASGNAKILAGGTDLLVQLRAHMVEPDVIIDIKHIDCLLYTSPSPRDQRGSRMPSSA